MKIAIVGLGKYGTLLTEQLSKENHDIVVIDTDPKVIDNVVNQYDVKGYVGNGASYVTLQDADIKKFDLLLATTSTDELNILCCLVAKKLQITQTIARIRNPEYALQAQMMQNEFGISMTINPDYNTALDIARSIRFPSAITVEDFSNGKVDLVEIKIDKSSKMNGLSLIQINNKYKTQLLVCAVRRGEEVIIPNGNFVIQEGDYAYITVSAKGIGTTFKKLNMFKNKVKSAMIIGGGRITYHLATMLLNDGIDVKIVDRNEEVCKSLSQLLPEALILHGDANDQKFLLSEGVDKVDVLVSLTGMDETNIIVSSFAKTIGVEKVITKVSNGHYDTILNQMGLDCIIAPKEIFADQIIRYVRGIKSNRGSEFKTLYRLVNNKVEAAEFFISKPTKYTSKCLKDLNIKKNILLACIIRGNKVIIPGGLDTIEPLDSVIVVSSDNVVKDVNDILE